MNNILNKILFFKRKEIVIKKILSLNIGFFFEQKSFSLKKKLEKSNTGIIAEFKRKSPSKGLIKKKIYGEEVVKAYENANAQGVSLLTDYKFFNGTNSDITKTKSCISIPLLRKDFLIDEYQIIESKAIGCDVILLIAEVITKKEIKKFTLLAKEFGLEVLMEFHYSNELKKLNYYLDFIGVNNRNLKNFIVNIKLSSKLYYKIPKDFIKISESGLANTNDVIYLKKKGYKGFLIGENFLLSKNHGQSCEEFINKITF